MGTGERLGSSPFWELRPFIAYVVSPSSLLPLIPHDLSRVQGTRKLLQPHLFPFLPSAPGAPCFPGGRGGTCLPQLRLNSHWDDPLETLRNKAPRLMQWQFSNALIPKLDGSSETIPGLSWLLERWTPRAGQDKPEITIAKQLSCL